MNLQICEMWQVGGVGRNQKRATSQIVMGVPKPPLLPSQATETGRKAMSCKLKL